MSPGVALVTGAAGFIGAHLTRRLATAGHWVRAVDQEPAPADLARPGVEYRQMDIRDPALSKLVEGVDVVHHLAAVHLSVAASPTLFQQVNVDAVRALVRASAAAGVRRVVHASSVGIYGHVTAPPAREGSPKHPTNEYERTKLAGEQAALETSGEMGVDLVILRPAWVYGPGCPRTAKLLRTVRAGRFVYIGDGSNLRHPVFVEDVIDAFELAAAATLRASHRTFIIAGPRPVSVRELVECCSAALGVDPPRRSLPRGLGKALGLGAEALFGLIGREPPFSRRSLTFFQHDNAFDTTEAQRVLGFAAQIDLEEGLRRTLSVPRDAGPRSKP